MDLFFSFSVKILIEKGLDDKIKIYLFVCPKFFLLHQIELLCINHNNFSSLRAIEDFFLEKYYFSLVNIILAVNATCLLLTARSPS